MFALDFQNNSLWPHTPPSYRHFYTDHDVWQKKTTKKVQTDLEALKVNIIFQQTIF